MAPPSQSGGTSFGDGKSRQFLRQKTARVPDPYQLLHYSERAAFSDAETGAIFRPQNQSRHFATVGPFSVPKISPAILQKWRRFPSPKSAPPFCEIGAAFHPRTSPTVCMDLLQFLLRLAPLLVANNWPHNVAEVAPPNVRK